MNEEVTEKKEIPKSIEEQEKLIHSIEKEIQESVKEKDETIENLNMRLEEVETKIQQNQEKLIEDIQKKHEKTINDLQKENELMIEQIKKDFQKDIQEKEKTIDKLKKFEEQNTRQVKVIKNLKEQIEEKSKEFKEKDKQLEKAIGADEKLVSKIDELKSDLKEKIEKNAEYKKIIDNFNKKDKGHQDDYEKLKSDYESLKNLKAGLIQGRENIISLMNNLLDNAKMRVLLCTPTIEDIKELDLEKLDKKVNVRIATYIDMKSEEHKEILDTFSGYANITFRSFDKKDRWGLEHDREAIILAAHSERFPLGMLSDDPNHIAFFSALLSEAWISGKPL